MVMFTGPTNSRPVYNSSIHRTGVLSGTPLPQDSMVDYDGLNIMARGDLRSTYLDAYYVQTSQLYLEIDGRRYNSMDLNLSNPALSAYLVTQAGL